MQLQNKILGTFWQEKPDCIKEMKPIANSCMIFSHFIKKLFQD